MDATIAAAWIGAGVGGGVAVLGLAGTVAASIVNSNNTRKATEQTVTAGTDANNETLKAAREDRLWEKQAAAYEAMLTQLLHRQAKRHFDLSDHRTSDAQQMKNFYESYQLPGVFETESRLTAYASNAVMNAYKATRGAHAAVVVAYSHRASLRESNTMASQTGRTEGVVNQDTMTDAQGKLDAALREADTTDARLIEIIRQELRSYPGTMLRAAQHMRQR